MHPVGNNYGPWVIFYFFKVCMYKHCFLPLLLVMKCCVKMHCSRPHNPYCCSRPSPMCLLHLLICTCINSSPIACPPSSVLCWCLLCLCLFCYFGLLLLVYYLCLFWPFFLAFLRARLVFVILNMCMLHLLIYTYIISSFTHCLPTIRYINVCYVINSMTIRHVEWQSVKRSLYFPLEDKDRILR